MGFLQTAPPSQSVIPTLSREQFLVPAVRFLLIGLLALVLEAGIARAETPTEAVDRVWNAFANLDPHRSSDNNFPQQFWILSRTVAHDQGVAVIAPIMARSKDWKDEEALIFVPLVAFLPKDQAIPILNRYKKEGKPWEQQCADDLLIEINSNDVKEAQKEFLNK